VEEEEHLAMSNKMRVTAVSVWVTAGIALYELAESVGTSGYYEEAAECLQRALRWGVWGGEETGDSLSQIQEIEGDDDEDEDEDEEGEEEVESIEDKVNGNGKIEVGVEVEVEADGGPWTSFRILPVAGGRDRGLSHKVQVLLPVRGRVRPYSADLGCGCEVLLWLV
jgi:hypothetical protein